MRIRSGLMLASLTAMGLATTGCGDDGADDGSTTGGQSGGDVEVTGTIAENTTWTRDKAYILKGIVRVEPGATLTIEAGTRVLGDKGSSGTLVIKRGARIMAEGTADEPILFTSRLPDGEKAAGDWGGLIILGGAPINATGGTATVEGLTSDETYGGDDAADDSGVLRYARIEYSGIELSADNEVNGLTMAGVGSGTTIDHVMVRHTLDDCFEWFGGTVNASHLVCYRNGDDGFDFDQGYTGNLQFLFAQLDPAIADSANGFEADNDEEEYGKAPVTNPTIYNVTLVGQHGDIPKEQFGLLLRRGFNATIGNAIIMGFEAGLDIRDAPDTAVTLTNTTLFDNAPENVAYPEDGSNEEEQADDDGGLDERGWFLEGAGNDEVDAELADPYATIPDPRPAAMIPGGAPSGSFFDAGATYRGAFRDASDGWMSGAWVSFE
jgi:hypothetical protein